MICGELFFSRIHSGDFVKIQTATVRKRQLSLVSFEGAEYKMWG